MSDKIRKIGDPVLRQKTEEVTEFNQDLSNLIQEMTTAMREARGIGLAANQIGVSKAVCIVDVTAGLLTPKVYVNPKILSGDNPTDFDEGCLSIPGVTGVTRRYRRVELEYQDLQGNKITEELFDMWAIAIQHEVDHLNGKLYPDKMSKIKRKVLLDKYERKQNGGN